MVMGEVGLSKCLHLAMHTACDIPVLSSADTFYD